MTTIKKVGDKTEPCLTPQLTLKLLEKELLSFIRFSEFYTSSILDANICHDS